MVIFEQPLNERIRMFVRLQQLFMRINHYADQDNEWDIHTSVMLLLDLYDLASRIDLKSEVMKELERQFQSLSQFSGSSQIDSVRLPQVLEQQREFITKLHEQKGQITQHLKLNEFMSNIRQRCTNSGGLCSHDMPMYHHWLNQSAGECKRNIEDWMKPFSTALQAIDLALETIRCSDSFGRAVASNGFFQQAIGGIHSPQMIRVRISGDLFPEISGSKHLMAVRFFQYKSVNERTPQASGEVNFEYTVCMTRGFKQ